MRLIRIYIGRICATFPVSNCNFSRVRDMRAPARGCQVFLFPLFHLRFVGVDFPEKRGGGCTQLGHGKHTQIQNSSINPQQDSLHRGVSQQSEDH